MRYWYDTEFLENGHDRPILLLSIGIVAEDGREFYAQNIEADWLYVSRVSPWINDNVLAHMQDCSNGFRQTKSEHSPWPCSEGCPWYTRSLIREYILLFMDPAKYGKPELWGYYADYDHVLFAQLFGRMIDLPKDFPMYTLDIKQEAVRLGNPKLPEQGKGEHHALADARWNRQAWEFLRTYKPACPCGTEGCGH